MPLDPIWGTLFRIFLVMVGAFVVLSIIENYLFNKKFSMPKAQMKAIKGQSYAVVDGEHRAFLEEDLNGIKYITTTHDVKTCRKCLTAQNQYSLLRLKLEHIPNLVVETPAVQYKNIEWPAGGHVVELAYDKNQKQYVVQSAFCTNSDNRTGCGFCAMMKQQLEEELISQHTFSGESGFDYAIHGTHWVHILSSKHVRAPHNLCANCETLYAQLMQTRSKRETNLVGRIREQAKAQQQVDNSIFAPPGEANSSVSVKDNEAIAKEFSAMIENMSESDWAMVMSDFEAGTDKG